MKNPTFTDFIKRVGGASVIYLVVILFTNSLAPHYTGWAVVVVTLLIFSFVAISETKAKAKSNKKSGKRA